MIEFIPAFDNDSNYIVRVNSICAGTLEPKEDGYWDWYPEITSGYIPAYVLRAITNKLDVLNKVWNVEVTETVTEN